MSKLITKTFYVSDADFMLINSKHDSAIVLRNRDESHFEFYIKNRATHEIQISWQEPEKKVEITESGFQVKLRRSVPISWTDDLLEQITNNFFGASDDQK